MKIIQIYDSFLTSGGAQNVAFSLFSEMKNNGYQSFLSSLTPYEDQVFGSQVSRNDYIVLKLTQLSVLNGVVVFSHHRKMTTLLLLLRKVLCLNFFLIHVAHTVFSDKKLLSFFPKKIVAVSEAVKTNLVDYFGINQDRITVIYNGLSDSISNIILPKYNSPIRILHVGRIENVKQQVKLVKYLNGKLNSNTYIDFAGDGSKVEELKEVIGRSNCNFKYIGYCSEIPKLYEKYHYSLLFSEKEGLGLSLVEACMAGRPLITRGAGDSMACAEVCSHGVNGYVVDTIDSLVEVLNGLQYITESEYHRLCNNSRSVFMQRFSNKNMINQYVDLVESIEPRGNC